MAANDDVRALLAPLLARVEAADQPLVLAKAERLAAERYRMWADACETTDVRDGLLACARREEEIADRVEASLDDRETRMLRVREVLPDLASTAAEVFDVLSTQEQYRLQASGERAGASTWQAFADADPERAPVYTVCAELEEENAEFLEDLLASISDPAE